MSLLKLAVYATVAILFSAGIFAGLYFTVTNL